jgi:hypothetical protein
MHMSKIQIDLNAFLEEYEQKLKKEAVGIREILNEMSKTPFYGEFLETKNGKEMLRRLTNAEQVREIIIDDARADYAEGRNRFLAGSLKNGILSMDEDSSGFREVEFLIKIKIKTDTGTVTKMVSEYRHPFYSFYAKVENASDYYERCIRKDFESFFDRVEL